MSVKIITPSNDRKFSLSRSIDFKGTADSAIVTIQLVADDKWTLATVSVNAGTWAASYQFHSPGQRKIVAVGLDATGRVLESDSLDISLYPVDKFETFAFPEPSNSSQIKALDLWATYYDIHIAKNIANGNPLLDTSGNRVGPTLSNRDWCYASMEGTVSVVDDNENILGTYNFVDTGSSSQVDCSVFFPNVDAQTLNGISKSCFGLSKGPYGEGVSGYILAPYRSIAVDNTEVPIGSVIYIPDARGEKITLSSGTTAIHDGYFFAADGGGLIRGNHIDVFIGASRQNPFAFITSDSNSTFAAFLINDTQIEQALVALHSDL